MRMLLGLIAMIPQIAFAGELRVSDAWIPTAPPSARAHAGYMTISNDSAVPVSIVGVTAEGYMLAHLHMTVETDGVSSMTPVHQIDIPAHQSATLAPGGMHIMLMRPQNPIKAGDMVTLTLELLGGEALVTDAIVKDRDVGG